MVSLGKDLFGGRYSKDEIDRILDINSRPYQLRKPDQAFYKKNGLEQKPSWAEKREFVDFLIHDSNISQSAKAYLQEN